MPKNSQQDQKQARQKKNSKGAQAGTGISASPPTPRCEKPAAAHPRSVIRTSFELRGLYKPIRDCLGELYLKLSQTIFIFSI